MIDNLINNFVAFIRASWMNVEYFIRQDESGSLKDDWLQANWELFVEGPLSKDEKIYLEVYGDGADANSPSSRILFPDAQATHAVLLRPKVNMPIRDCLNDEMMSLPEQGMLVDRFVTIGKNGWYCESLPFDKVLVIGKELRVFNITDVEFFLDIVPK